MTIREGILYFINNGQGALRTHDLAVSIENETSGNISVILRGKDMKTGDTVPRGPVENEPMDVLQRFVEVFISKGRLNQTLRIKHRGRRYRIFCSESKFFAYQINDNFGVSWGFPGWPVCIVTSDQIIDDPEMSGGASTEPSVHDWLRCMAEDDF